MEKAKEVAENLENLVSQKAKSFNEQTSPEEILALAELVRAITSYKKVNNLTLIGR
ncbi:hypothetical protein AAGS61_02800 [Lysinibacillus sp. KU-BSD001]|uniref:hypothetical protein n=1 Tax=Lysinibacillus sp. KU-BSD001 TaxID=3141328 RepID=UPI0036EEC061